MNSAIWRMGSRHGVVYVDNRDVAQAILACAASVNPADTEMAVYFRNGKRVGWQFRFTLEFWDRVSEMVGAPPRNPTPASLLQKSQVNAGVARTNIPPTIQPAADLGKATPGPASTSSTPKSRKPANRNAANAGENSAGKGNLGPVKPAAAPAKRSPIPEKYGSIPTKHSPLPAKQPSRTAQLAALAVAPAAPVATETSTTVKKRAAAAKQAAPTPDQPPVKAKGSAASVKPAATKSSTMKSTAAEQVAKPAATNAATDSVEPVTSAVTQPRKRRTAPVRPVQSDAALSQTVRPPSPNGNKKEKAKADGTIPLLVNKKQTKNDKTEEGASTAASSSKRTSAQPKKENPIAPGKEVGQVTPATIRNRKRVTKDA